MTRWIALPLATLFLLLVACSDSEAAQETPPQEPTAVDGAGESTPTAEEQTEASPQVPPEAPAGPAFAVEFRNAHEAMPGVLFGGQPTPAQFEAAADAGCKTVVNMRRDGEPGTDGEPELIEELGMLYVHLPIGGPETYTKDNAERFAALLEDPENLPMIVHCGSGHRIGLMYGLKAFHVDGLEADAALQLALDNGMSASRADTLRGVLKR